MSVSLSSLVIPEKTVSFEYPGMPGFNIELNHLSRESLIALRKKCVTTKFTKGRQIEEVLDDEIFLQEYTKSTVKGWSGFSYKYANKLLLIDISSVNQEDEIPFTIENAQTLLKNSSDFEQWVSETINDLQNFTKSK
jgi:hypothetical protein